MILTWPSDPSWWNWSKTQFSACLIFQSQTYLLGSFVSMLSPARALRLKDDLPPRRCLLPMNSRCKSLNLLPGIYWIILLPVFSHFLKVNSNLGPTTNHTVTFSVSYCSVVELYPWLRAAVMRLWRLLMPYLFSRGYQLQHTLSYLCSSSSVEELVFFFQIGGQRGLVWDEPVTPVIQFLPLFKNYDWLCYLLVIGSLFSLIYCILNVHGNYGIKINALVAQVKKSLLYLDNFASTTYCVVDTGHTAQHCSESKPRVTQQYWHR